MANTMITLLTYAFDLFLILIFFNNTLQNRKANVPGYIFYGSYCIMEALLYVSETLSGNRSFLLTLSVSFLTSYALTFLYQSSMRHRLFSAVSFQFFAILGESIFTMLMEMIRPSIFSIDEPSLFIIMSLGSKAALFLLVLLVSLFWHRKFSGQNLNYHIFILATPLASLTVMLFTPLEDIINGHNRTFFLCLYVTLSLLNMLNYWLLVKTFRQEQELHRLRQMETQIAYQKERYAQLSTAYKTNRRLIHDTKKHYFILQEHLKRQEYRELRQYLQISMEEIENTYTEINTGNLVIDAFVSNFKSIARTGGIRFSSTLQVDPDRIPVNDYDLCVILGNLLDNGLNACRKNAAVQNHIALTVTVSENDIFYIHTENSYHHAEKSTARQKSDFQEHGYGIANIRNIVEKYHGFIKYEFGDLFSMDIIIPIIDVKKRLHPPVKPPPVMDGFI